LGADIRELQSYNSKSAFANMHNFVNRAVDVHDVLDRFTDR